MTKENIPHFSGKNLSPEQSEEIQASFETLRAKGIEKMPGEVEKSQEELDFIEKANEYLAKELQELGIQEYRAVQPEQVHFLSAESFTDYMRKSEGKEVNPEVGSLTNEASGAIVLNKDHGNRLQQYRSIFHEMTHALSFQNWIFDLGRNEGRVRFGYSIHSTESKVVKYHKLAGFNEAVVEGITYELMNKYKDELMQTFHFTEEEQSKPIFSYNEPRRILDTIIAGIANRKGADKSDIWQKIKRGHFSGQIMHLRDIEDTYGEDSLQILSLLYANISELTPEKLEGKILRYFETDDDKKRNTLRKKLIKITRQ